MLFILYTDVYYNYACCMHVVHHVYNYSMLLSCIVYCVLFVSHMVCFSLYAAIGDQLNARFNLKVSVNIDMCIIMICVHVGVVSTYGS